MRPERLRESETERLFPAPRGRVLPFRSPWAGGESLNRTGIAVACVSLGAWFVPIFVRVLHHRFTAGGDDAEALHDLRPWPALAGVTWVAGAAALRFADRALRDHRRTSLLVGLAASAVASGTSTGLHAYVYQRCRALEIATDLEPAVLMAVLGLGFVLTGIAAAAAAWMLAAFARGSYHPARPSPLEHWKIACTCSAGLGAAALVLAFLSV